MQLKELQLAINIDHIASLRAIGRGQYPDPVHAALEVEAAGADQVKVHLKRQSPHITYRDVNLINEVLNIGLNIEIALDSDFIEQVCEIKPESCCIVADDLLAHDEGAQLAVNSAALKDAAGQLKSVGIQPVISISPTEQNIASAAEYGFAGVAFHLSNVLHQDVRNYKQEQLDEVQRLAKVAADAGLLVSAGHGVNYHNITALASITDVNRINVGHAVVARAVVCGLDAAVKELKSVVHGARLNLLAQELSMRVKG